MLNTNAINSLAVNNPEEKQSVVENQNSTANKSTTSGSDNHSNEGNQKISIESILKGPTSCSAAPLVINIDDESEEAEQNL